MATDGCKAIIKKRPETVKNSVSLLQTTVVFEAIILQTCASSGTHTSCLGGFHYVDRPTLCAGIVYQLNF